MTEAMEDLITFLKTLNVTKEDIVAIALIVKSSEKLADELNGYLVEKIKTNQHPTSQEILSKAIQIAKE
ncbi:MAG: hypothetical protein IJ921_03140, partial [Paludibacteraceae bacterium]|nr:hypothetical protein [Paludibacteraceae bacterium]